MFVYLWHSEASCAVKGWARILKNAFQLQKSQNLDQIGWIRTAGGGEQTNKWCARVRFGKRGLEIERKILRHGLGLDVFAPKHLGEECKEELRGAQQDAVLSQPSND